MDGSSKLAICPHKLRLKHVDPQDCPKIGIVLSDLVMEGRGK